MANRRLSRMHQFLQEVEASVLLTDVRGFLALTASLSPVELGAALSSFYAHTGNVVERHGGRVVKFVGDGLLGAFVGMGDHRERALAALGELDAHRDQWLADNAKVGLPRLGYAAAVASGSMVAGELGTDQIRFWDVLGAPVNLVFGLCRLAKERSLHHLIDEATVKTAKQGPPTVEVEPVELGGKVHRLYRLRTPAV